MPKRTAAPITTRARLAKVIKAARETMRTDAGLNSDLDRIPQLAWLLFLKTFDTLEANSEITSRTYRPAIAEPYRWRDWAADPIDGLSGKELIEFVNTKLLPYLRNLSGSGPRDVIAQVFKETSNNMLSGFLLRDLVNYVDQIDFASADDIHTMAVLYESMLREMRDAAGNNGEFYTPRPLIRFIIQQVDPRLGETVLDPAVGTGGFLVEAIEHLRPQVQTVQQLRQLDADVRGIEKKPMSYLLGVMNLLLHEVKQPAVVRGNALAHSVTQIRRADRVDIIVTNPPFGGEEEKGIAANFPEKTSETAWLFLQLVQRRLAPSGRCAIIVPNGVLFEAGVGARIKKRLLQECNLHTIVRLPEGVFTPYTSIPVNVLFFEKTGPTKEVWFYEHTPPQGRNYTKTRPLRSEDLQECIDWWGGHDRKGREQTARAWRVPIEDIEADSYNLSRSNPTRPEDLAHRPPGDLLAEIIKIERDLMAVLDALDAELDAPR